MSSLNAGVIGDVEVAAEEAFAAAFAQAMPDIQRNQSEEVDQLQIPRVDLVAQKTGEGPHEKLVNGTWYYDQWSVQLAIRLVTSPDEGTSSARRRLIETTIRNGIQGGSSPGLITFDLAYHFLADFRLSPASRSILEEESAVATEWTLDLMLFAKPDAW